MNAGVSKIKNVLNQEETKRKQAEASLATSKAQMNALELIIQQLCLVPIASEYAQTH